MELPVLRVHLVLAAPQSQSSVLLARILLLLVPHSVLRVLLVRILLLLAPHSVLHALLGRILLLAPHPVSLATQAHEPQAV